MLFFRELQAEHQLLQNFQEKCKNLASIWEMLEQESRPRKAQSYYSLKEMLTVQQVNDTLQILHILLFQMCKVSIW